MHCPIARVGRGPRHGGRGEAAPYTDAMSTPEFDTSRLDVSAFAKVGGRLEGEWPLAQFERLRDLSMPGASSELPTAVSWSARGEKRAARSGEAQVWLHVRAEATLPLECQRCLSAVSVALSAERSFLFVHGEDAAAQLDASSEDDVLALTRALDLPELIEDELLLSLPIVPRHDVCPEPLQLAADLPAAEPEPSPFAALASLKRSGRFS